VSQPAIAPGLDGVMQCPACLLDWSDWSRGSGPRYEFHETSDSCLCRPPVPIHAHMGRQCPRCGYRWAEQAGIREPRAKVPPRVQDAPPPRYMRDQRYAMQLRAADAAAFAAKFTGKHLFEINYLDGQPMNAKPHVVDVVTFDHAAKGMP
jgi:hypothetical protein